MAQKLKNKRATARLMAVQALYQLDISGADVAATLDEFPAPRVEESEDRANLPEADSGWFRHIVNGVVKYQRELDPAIHTMLTDDWPLNRIDVTLRAILRCGVYELLHRPDVPAKVIINEYIDIAGAFYDGAERKLVNGVLNGIAQEHRESEL